MATSFRFPSAAGSDWYFHARQDPYPQDLPHPDLQSSSVAEDSRVCCHGSLSGTFMVKCIVA